MKRLRTYSLIAIGLLLSGAFLAFQSIKPSAEAELKWQRQNADFKVVPLNDYDGHIKDLPEGTKKFTKITVDARTKLSSENSFLKIPK